MGLSIDGTRFLVRAWKKGASFNRILTLGRQHMTVGPERLVRIFQEEGAQPAVQKLQEGLASASWRFDAFAAALGAEKIVACDASAYEGAALIHDLNYPIPAEWEQQYDLVIDGGTLEHVFNYPVAIANAMKWVKVGGHLVLVSPANNYFGHGFYQFSPELLYRVLCPENGYEIVNLIAVADAEGVSQILGVNYTFPLRGSWYAVRDPAIVRERVTLINTKGVLLYALAKRINANPIFRSFPHQSDYVPQWQAGTASGLAQSQTGSRAVAWLRRRFNETFCREILPRAAWLVDPFRYWRFRRRNSFANKNFYRLNSD